MMNMTSISGDDNDQPNFANNFTDWLRVGCNNGVKGTVQYSSNIYSSTDNRQPKFLRQWKILGIEIL